MVKSIKHIDPSDQTSNPSLWKEKNKKKS